MTPEQAENLLRDDNFLGELEKIRGVQLATLLNTDYDQIDIRENAYRMLKCLSEVVTHFQSIVDSAELKRRRWKIL